jgi:hypothetical protein
VGHRDGGFLASHPSGTHLVSYVRGPGTHPLTFGEGNLKVNPGLVPVVSQGVLARQRSKVTTQHPLTFSGRRVSSEGVVMFRYGFREP